MNDCLFCKIIRKEVPSHTVYEDADVAVFLDIFPVSKGHLLFVPKQHAQDLSAGSAADARRLMEEIYRLAPAIQRALGASGYNLGMNHGVDAGQEVFHTHMHFMPRYAGEPRRFEKMSPTQEELQTIADQIRSGL